MAEDTLEGQYISALARGAGVSASEKLNLTPTPVLESLQTGEVGGLPIMEWLACLMQLENVTLFITSNFKKPVSGALTTPVLYGLHECA